ncbi:unnamed protein product [Spodoptera littoralis]|uniref:Uncharacterized protein n=1 Tax=Spodoptera littoralis TaxID=7109 RepID=A0A9P0N5N2_SPOLI|nr:unnamed protein product [Spodoptera littoralis]CAH1643338.1 unnamed protein product [Spodoptera littoralis]
MNKKFKMFRLLRQLVRIVAAKVRKIEMIVFNASVKRRGTIHSVCDRGTLGHAARRRGTIHSICEVRSTLYTCYSLDTLKKLISIIPSSLPVFTLFIPSFYTVLFFMK